MKLLLIDNYDSFTYNLEHYLRALELEVHVLRNDQFEIELVGFSLNRTQTVQCYLTGVVADYDYGKDWFVAHLECPPRLNTGIGSDRLRSSSSLSRSTAPKVSAVSLFPRPCSAP